LKVARTVFGWDIDPASNANSIKEIKDVLKILNAALKGKQYFVGERFTLADIALWTALLLPFTLALDAGVRKAFPDVSAWFERVSKLPEVVKVAGAIKLPAKGLKPVTA
jgi:glutathione S-transferase